MLCVVTATLTFNAVGSCFSPQQCTAKIPFLFGVKPNFIIIHGHHINFACGPAAKYRYKSNRQNKIT